MRWALDTLLGAFESEYKFGRSLMAFLGAKKTKREHNEELERSLFLAKENLRNVDRLISTEHMSFNLAAFRHAHDSEEGRQSGSELKALITDYAAQTGMAVKSDAAVVEIREAPKDGVKNKMVRRGTFDHDLATKRVDLEFFAFGHEYIDTCAAEILAAADKSPVVRVNAQRDGMLFFFFRSRSNSTNATSACTVCTCHAANMTQRRLRHPRLGCWPPTRCQRRLIRIICRRWHCVRLVKSKPTARRHTHDNRESETVRKLLA